ncbi:MAG: hypothetical protein D6703_02785 [Zetaproteobacteria bacterium]|nr:MAG: hypothetical protein D6703_02785 [Zetaproteobacteria bacterium]
MAALISRALGWLHCPPWSLLIIAAIVLGLAPFTGEPHLIGKVRLLLQGELVRPIDIVDLFWHAWPMAWLVLRLLTSSTAASCRFPVR